MTESTPPATAALTARRRGWRPAGGAELVREYGIVISFVVLFVVLAISSGAFLSKDNLLNLVDGTAPIGIIALTLTLVVLGGQLDFSSGAVYGLAGIVAAQTADSVGAWPAIFIGIGVGVAVGLVNGVLVAYAGIESFICTLATSIIVAGLGLVVTNGSLVSATDPTFMELGNGTFLDVSYATWILLAFAVVLTFVAARTLFGRYVYGVGDNATAARLSGIRTRMVTAATFVVAGAGAATAGVIIASRTSQGQPQDGINLVLTAIAAVVVGGTSVAGGRGAIWRTLLGVLFLALIGNGLNLLSIDPVYQQIVQGAIILTAVAIDRVSRGRA